MPANKQHTVCIPGTIHDCVSQKTEVHMIVYNKTEVQMIAYNKTEVQMIGYHKYRGSYARLKSTTLCHFLLDNNALEKAATFLGGGLMYLWNALLRQRPSTSI